MEARPTPKFPSQEWIEAFRERINASDAYARVAKDWEGDFLFVVEPEGDLSEPASLHVNLWHGNCRDAHILEPGGR